MSQEILDTELVSRITNKDSTALEQLYDRYERPMYYFAYRILHDQMMAEEAVQELFMRIWNSAERYNNDQGKLSTWMFTLIRNIAIDMLRKKKKGNLEPLTEEKMAVIADTSNHTELEVEAKLVGEQVKAALAGLNPDQKKIMEWIYFQGLTHQEVAKVHSIPLGTVKSRVRLALRQLQKRLSHIGMG
jgi:RNA polymerase sigma factor (sigma-70 family)